MKGEKTIQERLNERYAEEVGDSPTMQEEREAAGRKAEAHKTRDEQRQQRFASIFEKAAQAARSIEAGDTEAIEVKGAQVLLAKLEDYLGKGGIHISREEVRSVKAHKDASNDQFTVTDEALMSYAADILLPSGGTKVAKCVVSYDASQRRGQQYEVKDVFYDSLDQERPLTEEGLKDFLNGVPLKEEKAANENLPADEKPLVFFNASNDVVGFEEIECPQHIRATAVNMLRKANFEVDVEHLDTTTGIGKQAYVIIARPDRHDEMRTLVAQIVKKWDDKSWFDRATDDHDKYGVTNWAKDDGWFERSLQSSGPRMETVDQPNDWFERSLEKPAQEGAASSAYEGTKMLRFEKKREAQAKTPAKGRAAEKGKHRARRQAKVEDNKRVLDVADRMERLAGGAAPKLPFRLSDARKAALQKRAQEMLLDIAPEELDAGPPPAGDTNGLADRISDEAAAIIEEAVIEQLEELHQEVAGGDMAYEEEMAPEAPAEDILPEEPVAPVEDEDFEPDTAMGPTSY